MTVLHHDMQTHISSFYSWLLLEVNITPWWRRWINSYNLSMNVPILEAGSWLTKQQINTSLPSVLSHCWLGVQKSIRPIKNWVMKCWHGYLVTIWIYDPADATAIPSSLGSLKSRRFLYLSGANLSRLSCKNDIKRVLFQQQPTVISCKIQHSISLFWLTDAQCLSYLGTQSLPMTTDVMKLFVSSWQAALSTYEQIQPIRLLNGIQELVNWYNQVTI